MLSQIHITFFCSMKFGIMYWLIHAITKYIQQNFSNKDIWVWNDMRLNYSLKHFKVTTSKGSLQHAWPSTWKHNGFFSTVFFIINKKKIFCGGLLWSRGEPTAGSLMQQEKGTPHLSLLRLLSEQLKYTFRFQSLGSLAPQQWFCE